MWATISGGNKSSPVDWKWRFRSVLRMESCYFYSYRLYKVYLHIVPTVMWWLERIFHMKGCNSPLLCLFNHGWKNLSHEGWLNNRQLSPYPSPYIIMPGRDHSHKMFKYQENSNFWVNNCIITDCCSTCRNVWITGNSPFLCVLKSFIWKEVWKTWNFFTITPTIT